MTDKKITARRQDIVIVNKGQRKTTLIDIACPCDRNVNEKETEKVEKYQDLKIELQRLWNTSVEIVPIVVGALGAISSNLQKYPKDSAIENSKYLKETSWSLRNGINPTSRS